MIHRHQVFEVTIELGTGLFIWNRHIIGEPTREKVLHLLDKEIEESIQHPLNKLGTPSLVALHGMYYDMVADFGMPKGSSLECVSYGTKVGMIYVIRLPEVVQIEDS